jgi:tetratricopeptide (TPR) repeat protein
MYNLTKKTFLITLIFPLITFVYAQDSTDFIMKGNEAFSNFDNEAALNYYSKALEKDSGNYEAAWKLSRAYVDVGETFKDKDTRKKYYKKGEVYARRAVDIDSSGSKGHLYLSISLGRVALDAGKKEQVRLSKEIKIEVDKALELDPNDDIALHVLGRWHRKMATLGWIQRKFANIFLGGVPKDASVEESAKCFEKAIEINPGHINHYLELGITYEELDRKDDAIKQYEALLKLPKKDSDDDKYKEEAKIRLEKIKK